MATKSGVRMTGTFHRVATTDEIVYGQLYAITAHLSPLGYLSDETIQYGVDLLVGLDDPIDVTYCEVGTDGTVLIQGRATHNSPILLITGAVVLVLAGIGLTLVVESIYAVTDAVVFGGKLPGGAAGDDPTAPLTLWDYAKVALLILALFVAWRYWRGLA